MRAYKFTQEMYGRYVAMFHRPKSLTHAFIAGDGFVEASILRPFAEMSTGLEYRQLGFVVLYLG
jgi:hypothetical protein